MKYKTYIGTKIIEAMACDASHAASILNRKVDADVNAPGYLVKYPDGYESWSPLKAFEEAYRISDNIPFGLALEAIKKRHKVARRGWNGKDIFIYLQESSNMDPENARNPILRAYAEQFDGSPIFICGHIDMKAADGTIVIGWLASQTDMLSDDWFILD